MHRTTTRKNAGTPARSDAKVKTRRARLSKRALHGIARLSAARSTAGTLSVPTFKGWVETFDLGLPVWSAALHMPEKALNERIAEGGRFHPLEADRLHLVQQVLDRGMAVFEDKDDLSRWLDRKHPLLDDRRPMDLLGSTAGIGLVMMELGRIEHGVY